MTMTATRAGAGRPPRQGMDFLDLAIRQAAENAARRGERWTARSIAGVVDLSENGVRHRVGRLESLGLWPFGAIGDERSTPEPLGEGQRAACARLFGRVRSLARRVAGPDGDLDEIESDALARLVWCARRLHDPAIGDWTGWAIACCRKQARLCRYRSYLRRAAVASLETEADDETLARVAVNPVDAGDGFRSLCRTLTEKEAAVASLVFEHDFSVTEAARAAGVSRQHAHTLMRSIKEKVKSRVESDPQPTRACA